MTPHINVHLRDGASQLQRLMAELQDGFVKVDERSLEELLTFAKQYAKSVLYFDHLPPNVNKENGDWADFFNFDPKQLLEQLSTRDNIEPHLALYLTFLQLIQTLQEQANGFTQNHLDFYYRNVLNLQPLNGRADEVHVVFELARTATEQFLAAGTTLDGGKDDTGTKRLYKLDNDIVVNTAVITDLRSTYVPEDKVDEVHYATVANSQDGLGGKLPPEDQSWSAFGREADTDRKLPALPVQKTGFALASQVLEMKEGDRIVTVEITLAIDSSFNLTEANKLGANALEIFYSGEKGWIGPNAATLKFSAITGSTQRVKMEITDGGLNKSVPAVTGYNAALLGKDFNTQQPLMQVLFTQTTSGKLRKMLLRSTVVNTRMKVAVNGVTTLQLQNDMGLLDPKKAFMPFGPIPVKGASFYVGYEEVLQKNIDQFSFDVSWQGAPESFRTHYDNYFERDALFRIASRSINSDLRIVGSVLNNSLSVLNDNNPISNNDYFTAKIAVKGQSNNINTKLFGNNATEDVRWPLGGAPAVTSIPSSYKILSNTFKSYYTDQKLVLASPNFYSYSNVGLAISNWWKLPLLNLVNPVKPVDTTKGFARITLDKDFFHKKYPGVFATRMREEVSEDQLPLEPYTPLIKTFSLNYTASTSVVNVNDINFSAFNTRELQFFHADVFGVAEQHGYLKDNFNKLLKLSSTNVFLLPQHPVGGAFYIGLDKVEYGQSVSCLFQLAEGSADPEADTQDVQWSILCSNEWRSFRPEELLMDHTNHLLRSGIIKWAIPAEASKDNTLFPAGKLWIRGQVKDPRAICRFIQLHTQAVKATFVQGTGATVMNVLAAGTISKLSEKLASIKKVEQPYGSDNGQLPENNVEFQTRVSERLRHKQRAVMAWDYERMVLQQFPEVYKVKCLQHSAAGTDSCCAGQSPGHVAIIVVPDLRNRNAINPLEPKVSKDTLVSIQDYLQAHTGMFVTLHVENPHYEKVVLDFKVRFKTLGDTGYYKKLLNEELKQFLSPWAFSASQDIAFGGAARKSVLLNFIDGRDYVDFVTDCNMYHQVGNKKSGNVNEIIVSDPRAILVSGNTHTINDYTLQDVCK